MWQGQVRRLGIVTMDELGFSASISKVLRERADAAREPASEILEGSEREGMDPEACTFTNVVQIFKRGELVNVKGCIGPPDINPYVNSRKDD